MQSARLAHRLYNSCVFLDSKVKKSREKCCFRWEVRALVPLSSRWRRLNSFPPVSVVLLHTQLVYATFSLFPFFSIFVFVLLTASFGCDLTIPLFFLQVLALRRSFLHRVLDYEDEFFALLMLVLESHSLRTTGSYLIEVNTINLIYVESYEKP